MKRHRLGLSVAIAIALVAQTALPASAARRSQVTAKAAILVDYHTGEVLWAHNPDVPLPPASTTKVVTAMLALQSNRLDESMMVTAKAAQEPPTKISLRSGWRVKLVDLVYAILLNSANDASVVIAEGLAESVRGFAARMNVYAYALGASNSHFVNPNGLPADDHYSSARDLTKLFAHGLRNPMFREVLSTQSRTIIPTAGSRRPIALRSKNRLLTGYSIEVIGKTGWTRAAGKCFVGSGRAYGRELLVAVLGSNDLWGDLQRLLEYGYDLGPEPQPRRGVTVVASAPARISAGDSEETGRYFVQLATFRSQEHARNLKRTIQKSGYPTHIMTVRGSKPLYRVSVGSYGDLDSARQVSRDITRKYPKLKLKPMIVGS